MPAYTGCSGKKRALNGCSSSVVVADMYLSVFCSFLQYYTFLCCGFGEIKQTSAAVNCSMADFCAIITGSFEEENDRR